MEALALLYANTSAPALEPLPLMDTVTVESTELKTKALPKGFARSEAVGLITDASVTGQAAHRTQTRPLKTRPTITPKGDYLVMLAVGYDNPKGNLVNAAELPACPFQTEDW